MDLTTGIVAFYGSCPGGLMKRLLRDDLESVRKIKSLQTTYSRGVKYGCLYACGGDITIANNFIEAIDALEELSINNFEKDVTALWPVILRHGKSLKSLTLHSTPEYYKFVTAAPSTVRKIAAELPHLTQLTIDINVKDAERLFNTYTRSSNLRQQQPDTGLGELVKIGHLKEVQVTINLDDEASAFAGKNEYGVMGSTSFPNIDTENSLVLARAIFDRFYESSVQCSLAKVGVRFSRHCFSDRFQYDIVMTSVRLIKDGAEFKTEADDGWDWNPKRVSSELWNVIIEANMELY